MGGEAGDPRGGRTSEPGREARLAAALRENLRRRKAQARGRIDAKPADTGPADTGPADTGLADTGPAGTRDTHER